MQPIVNPDLIERIVNFGTGTYSRVTASGETIYRVIYRKRVYDIVFPVRQPKHVLWVACVLPSRK
jgi:hypothetical protein